MSKFVLRDNTLPLNLGDEIGNSINALIQVSRSGARGLTCKTDICRANGPTNHESLSYSLSFHRGVNTYQRCKLLQRFGGQRPARLLGNGLRQVASLFAKSRLVQHALDGLAQGWNRCSRIESVFFSLDERVSLETPLCREARSRFKIPWASFPTVEVWSSSGPSLARRSGGRSSLIWCGKHFLEGERIGCLAVERPRAKPSERDGCLGPPLACSRPTACTGMT